MSIKTVSDEPSRIGGYLSKEQPHAVLPSPETGQCASCIFWRSVNPRVETLVGLCQRIVTTEAREAMKLPDIHTQEELRSEASLTNGALYTGADFGCKLHKGRKNSRTII